MSAIDWPNKKMPDEASKDLMAAKLGENFGMAIISTVFL